MICFFVFCILVSGLLTCLIYCYFIFTDFKIIDSEMAGRHKAQRESLHIVRTTEVKGDLVKNSRRAYIRQIVRPGARFPVLHKRIRCPTRYRSVFQANRPILNA